MDTDTARHPEANDKLCSITSRMCACAAVMYFYVGFSACTPEKSKSSTGIVSCRSHTEEVAVSFGMDAPDPAEYCRQPLCMFGSNSVTNKHQLQTATWAVLAVVGITVILLPGGVVGLPGNASTVLKFIMKVIDLVAIVWFLPGQCRDFLSGPY